MPARTAAIPLSNFEGMVRQIDVQALNDIGRAALDFAFPGFLEQPFPTQKQVDGMRRMLLGGADYVTWQKKPKRRFSGGEELPRGRYYTTLATAGATHDNGTLMRELLAYCIPKVSGLLVAVDLSDDRGIEFLGPGWKKDNCYVLAFLDEPEHRIPFIQFLEENQLLRAAFGRDRSTGGLFTVSIPYRNSQLTIPDTVDLRFPHVQEWFFNVLVSHDTEYLIKPDRQGAARFTDLLPTLLASEYGGNHLTESVGLWMRANSVSALVFPSARSNCALRIKDGRLVEWYGWNLIDYRGAPPPPAFQFVDLSPGWPTRLAEDVTIQVWQDGPNSGSWKVSGLEEYYEHILDQEQRAAHQGAS